MTYRPLTPGQEALIASGEVTYECYHPGPTCVMRDRDGNEGSGGQPREAFDALVVAQLEMIPTLEET